MLEFVIRINKNIIDERGHENVKILDQCVVDELLEGRRAISQAKWHNAYISGVSCLEDCRFNVFVCNTNSMEPLADVNLRKDWQTRYGQSAPQ